MDRITAALWRGVQPRARRTSPAPTTPLHVTALFGGDTLQLQGKPDTPLIERLYLEVLGRPADPGGLASSQGQIDAYRAAGLDEAAIEARLRQELKHSEEYRVYHMDAMIADLYQWKLGREPDPDGLAYHHAMLEGILARGGSGQDLYDAVVTSIEASDEYRGVNPNRPGAAVEAMISPWEISAILGSPLENVQAYWPMLADALAEHGMTDRVAVIAMLATIGTEAAVFAPIREYASGERYEWRTDLGNVYEGDGPRYKGRGFIQLTGRDNYRTYGRELGIDLEGNPDLALEPGIAAQIFVRYFRNRGVVNRARAGDWVGARIAVNGGLNGWEHFSYLVNQLSRVVRG